MLGVAGGVAATGAAVATSAATTMAGAAAGDAKTSPVFDDSSAAPTDYDTSRPNTPQEQRVGTGRKGPGGRSCNAHWSVQEQK